MASNAEVKAASYFGPMASLTPTGISGAAGAPQIGPGNNTIRRPSSSSSTSEALAVNTLEDGTPKVIWAGKYVDVTNESATDAVDFAYGIGAGTLIFGEQCTFEAGDVNAGERIQPGQTKGWIVPPLATHATWILGAAGPSTLTFRCSEGEVGAK